MNVIAAFLGRNGLKPNAATALGVLMSAGGAFLIAMGHMLWAAVLITFAGLFDSLDGRIARLQSRDKGFGALLDSSMDRYGDALFFTGVAYGFFCSRESGYFLLALSAMAGSFEVSYVRARAEGLGVACRVGFWERGERMAVLIMGLLSGNLHLAVILLGTLTHVTAAKRMLTVWNVMRCGHKGGEPMNRKSIAYVVCMAALAASHIWIRP